MTFARKLQELAKNPQAQKIVDKAKAAVQDPKNREKVSLVRERLKRRRSS